MNALRKDDSGSTVPNTSEKKLSSTHVTFLVLDTFLLNVAIL